MASLQTISAANSSFIEFTTYVTDAPTPVTISTDIVINSVGERINSAMWDSGDTTLEAGEFFTSSAQRATSGEYYLDVFRTNPDLSSSAVPQFSIAYGNYNGYGETGLEGQSDTMTPTKAIYTQYAALLEDKSTTDTDFKFKISGSAVDSIYVINIGRSQLKERVDSGNWELKIGDNKISLVDEYVGSGSNDLGDGPINVVSGSIGGGIVAGEPTSYGLFYPNYGVIVLNATELSGDVTGLTEDLSTSSYDGTGTDYSPVQAMTYANPDNFFSAISSGSYFKARSTEHLHSRTYFCRIPSYAANFSSNPTFVNTTLNDGSFLHPSMVGNPKTYITTVGLYDENNELMAVAKLSKPLLKSFNREALVRVRLEY